MALKPLPVLRRRGTCCAVPVVDRAKTESTAKVLRALADPTRLGMMAALWRAEAPVCICDFTASLDLSQPTISHHMAKLRDAGLVEAEKRGIWIFYRLSDDMPQRTRGLLATLID